MCQIQFHHWHKVSYLVYVNLLQDYKLLMCRFAFTHGFYIHEALDEHMKMKVLPPGLCKVFEIRGAIALGINFSGAIEIS